jgi:FkbM family methyltransferase
MNAVLRLVRRLATMPGLRRLTEIDALMRLSLSLRSSLVRQPWRFVWNELRRRRVTATYRLKESGLAITIRHKSPDILILDEMFSQHEYRLPEEVERSLARADRRLQIADVGANIGLFGVWILGRFPKADIVALEPDPANAEIHRSTISANGREASWVLHQAGAATEPGTLQFAVGSFATSHVARAGEAGVEVEGVDIFPLLAESDLVKLDIEGAEWPILQDPRFHELQADALVLEYHPEGSPGPDPAEAAQRLLDGAGFKVVDHHAKNNGTGVIWAVRSASDQA